MKYLFLLSIFLVAAKGCGDKKVEGLTTVEMGEEITLSVGEALRVAGSDTQGFMFVSVEQDGRCPRGVNCIQPGKATIVVEELNASPRQVSVPAGERGNPSFTIKGAKVEILGLNPYPTGAGRTPFEEYKLTVKLSPGGAQM